MINKTVWLFIFLISGMLMGCPGGGKTVSHTIFVNNSGQRITITPYAYGNIMTNYLIEIENSSRYNFRTSDRGVSAGSGSYGARAWPDSLVITYGNSARKIHLRNSITSTNTKAFEYDNKRNLINEKNYAFRITESASKYNELEYEYTFTKEDYEDALK
jgi:hypothetical protein